MDNVQITSPILWVASSLCGLFPLLYRSFLVWYSLFSFFSLPIFSSFACASEVLFKNSLPTPMSWSISSMFSSSTFIVSVLCLGLYSIWSQFLYMVWDTGLVSFFYIWISVFPGPFIGETASFREFQVDHVTLWEPLSCTRKLLI